MTTWSSPPPIRGNPPLRLTMNINRRLIGAGANWQAASQATQIIMPLPGSPDRGSSVTRTYSALAGEAVQLPAEADTFVRNGIYADTNYGTSATQPVQNYSVGHSRETLLKFDTSSLAGEIVYAEVRLLALSGTSPSTPATVSAAPLLGDDWDEATATWNARPASGPEIARTGVKQGQFASFDVTNLVREAVTSDNQFSLRLFAPAWSYYSANFGARENVNPAYQPVLEVYTRELMVDPPAEGESPARHVTLADVLAGQSGPQIIGPMRLSDFLASSRLFNTTGPQPALLSQPFVPVTPAPFSTNRSRYASRFGDQWQPDLVDLALTALLEPEPEDLL